MSNDAPERIYLEDDDYLWVDRTTPDSDGTSVEYIRADIHRSELREMALQLLSDDGQMADNVNALVEGIERLRGVLLILSQPSNWAEMRDAGADPYDGTTFDAWVGAGEPRKIACDALQGD